jgi:hypothetical protein
MWAARPHVHPQCPSPETLASPRTQATLSGVLAGLARAGGWPSLGMSPAGHIAVGRADQESGPRWPEGLFILSPAPGLRLPLGQDGLGGLAFDTGVSLFQKLRCSPEGEHF